MTHTRALRTRRAIAVRAPAPALLAALVLVLTACTSGGGPEESTPSPGPLSAQRAEIDGLLTEETYERLNDRREENIARCMKEKGWEYAPAQQVATIQIMDTHGGLSAEEFAATYGYGIAQRPPGAVRVGETKPDPNLPYLATLTPSEAEQWNEDLWGAPPDPSVMLEDDGLGLGFSASSCLGGAVVDDPLEGMSKADNDPRFREIADAIRNVWLTALDDPAVAEAQASWSECMADAGHPGHESPEDFERQVRDEIDDPMLALPQDAAVLDQLTEREIASAVPDERCQSEVQYQRVVAEATRAAEERLLTDHRATVEAYLEALRESAAEAQRIASER